MRRRPPRSTRTDTLFPYTTLFRSDVPRIWAGALEQCLNYLVAKDVAVHLGLQEMALMLPAFVGRPDPARKCGPRSEEHTSELQSLMRISYAVFCLKKKKDKHANILTGDDDQVVLNAD